MKRSSAWRLLPLLLLAACGGRSPVGDDAQLLGSRLQVQLQPQIAAGQATVQALPAGAQVTLAEQALFPNGGAQLDDRGRYVLASVVEGLLAPAILRIDLTQSSATPPALQQARLEATRRFFEDYLLGPALQAAGPSQAPPIAAVSGGTTITVTIVPG